MSSRPKELVITMTMTVKEPNEDRQGVEELYLRCTVMKMAEVLDIAGRGKFNVQTTYDMIPTKRRPSKRKPKSQGASNG